jgi:hypothetical protein
MRACIHAMLVPRAPGEVMRMAAEPGTESPGNRTDGSSALDAAGLAGRAWLVALPDELAAQRRVMGGLV